MIKLNTNENPYPPAPGVAEALKNLEPDRLRLYPDPACTRLVDAIAKQKGLKPEQIFVGVGSDDVLAMCFMTFFNPVSGYYLFFLRCLGGGISYSV